MRPGQTSLVVFLSKLLGSALGFLATIFFARVLGAEILGYYALVMAIVSWLVLAGRVGVTKAMTKRISETEEPAAYFTASAIIIGGLGAVTAGGVLLLNDYVDSYVGESVAVFVAVIVLVKLFYNFTDAALEGERKVHVAGVLQPIQIGTYSLVQVSLVAAGFGLVGMLVGYVVGGILIGLVGLWYLSVGIERPRVRHFRSLADFAKYAWLGGLQSRSFNDVDIVVLGVFVSPALVGIYSVAWSIAKFLTLFGGAVSQTLFPEMSSADAADDRTAVRGFVSDSLTYGGLVVIPGLFGGALLGERLLGIYGPAFTEGATVLVVLIAATLLYGYQRQLLNALNAIDRPDRSFRINAVFVVTNVVLNVALIAWLGIVGAAIATALSAALGATLAFVSLRSILSFPVPIGEIGRQLLAAIAMSLVVYAGLVVAATTGVTHNAAVVLALVTVGAGVYFSVLFTISTTFRETVRANSPVRVPSVR